MAEHKKMQPTVSEGRIRTKRTWATVKTEGPKKPKFSQKRILREKFIIIRKIKKLLYPQKKERKEKKTL